MIVRQQIATQFLEFPKEIQRLSPGGDAILLGKITRAIDDRPYKVFYNCPGNGNFVGGTETRLLRVMTIHWTRL